MDESLKNSFEFLGKQSVFNALNYSSATVRSRISHLKLLKFNNVDLNDPSKFDNDKQIVGLINSLRSTHNRVLSESYKRQLAITLKHLFPQSTFRPSTIFKKSSWKKTRSTSKSFMKDLHVIIKNCGQYLKNVQIIGDIEDIIEYDMCLSILITCSTSLRIGEILQLRLSDITKIRENKPVTIKSKSHGQTMRRIAINNVLNGVFNLIIIQRSMLTKYLKSSEFKRLNEQAQRYKLLRITDNFIISSSESSLRHKLHEFAANIGIEMPIMGFNIFRKFITSLLIEKGGYTVAQSMNNHSNLNTTIGHYNVITNETVEKIYDDLTSSTSVPINDELKDSNVPDDSITPNDLIMLDESRDVLSTLPDIRDTIPLPAKKILHPYDTPSYEADDM